jgi:hypothetical protein
MNAREQVQAEVKQVIENLLSSGDFHFASHGLMMAREILAQPTKPSQLSDTMLQAAACLLVGVEALTLIETRHG